MDDKLPDELTVNGATYVRKDETESRFELQAVYPAYVKGIPPKKVLVRCTNLHPLLFVIDNLIWATEVIQEHQLQWIGEECSDMWTGEGCSDLCSGRGVE